MIKDQGRNKKVIYQGNKQNRGGTKDQRNTKEGKQRKGKVAADKTAKRMRYSGRAYGVDGVASRPCLPGRVYSSFLCLQKRKDSRKAK